ncbi:TROVE domain-containing protein [Oscillochloris sp. ZM17-4]|uniref:TROVE domain-containing protein n=1 Tax=Oscillochloris sp. ZM17-4 TaxID=2866714 RepID=UPI001C72CA00|nr:TROVE domain-containing protein [Oscillochloris sp. ZM17-4]
MRNSAGGYSYPVDDWTRLGRFLVLGSEGGSYYAAERALTLEGAHAVARCLAEDGGRAGAEIVAVSAAGRAPKNDPALFALAMAATAEAGETRRAALAALPQVARTGTHLLHFAGYVQALRGWGRGLRRAVGAWFLEQPAERLVLQAIKYRQRDGVGAERQGARDHSLAWRADPLTPLTRRRPPADWHRSSSSR